MTLTTLRPIVFWGATGHGLVLQGFIEKLGYRVVAVFDNDPHVRPLVDAPLVIGRSGFEAWLRAQRGALPRSLVAVGGERGGERLALHDYMSSFGVQPAPVVMHPSAVVAKSARCAPGAQVLAGAVVGERAIIGRTTIINTRASIDHECELGDGVHIGPGATLCGKVRVGDRAFIGAGATVLPDRRIGEDAVVGAGAVVTRDVSAGSTVVGVPAKEIARKDGASRE